MSAAPPGGRDVAVVGAGVSGLTTAVCLAEAGLSVTAVASRPPAETTSAVAGAVWGLHLVEQSERTARWGRETLAVLRELATEPGTGVHNGTGAEAVRPHLAGPAQPSPWLAEVGGAQPCDPAGLPPGFAAGWRYTAPLIHMTEYLGYLAARLERAGGRITLATVVSLPAAAKHGTSKHGTAKHGTPRHGAAAVVNCSGAAAHTLVPDPGVIPYRGETLLVRNPGLTEFFIARADGVKELMYLFPHGDVLVLGGTETAGEWDTTPDPAQADRILKDWAELEPRLAGAQVLAHRAGLRPYRPQVRLEVEAQSGDGPLIAHNYGHGGAGVTLSWGCARELARQLTAALGHTVADPDPGFTFGK